MKIKKITKIKSKKPKKFYDITVDKYHNFFIGDSKICVHNSSLTKAISKLARPFGSSLQILEGYGFFGSEVCPEPAAARYTSVKLSNIVNNYLKEYNYLTSREKEGPYDPFWLDIPLGLTTTIVGIAVGYKSIVLPRKLEHIKEYLEGKRKKVNPYFENFQGSIKKYNNNNLNNSWIISSKVNINGNRIEIRGIPPILKYTSALKRLDWLFNRFEGKIRILNNSNNQVSIDIVYTGKNSEEWNEIQQFVRKVFSLIVTENPVFIKDGNVLVYDNIEQYLDDYLWQLKRLDYNRCIYERNFLTSDLEFNKAKKEFIIFMLEKRRSISEVDTFLKKYSKIKNKLESLTSKKFTKDELNLTEKNISRLITELKTKEIELKKAKTVFQKYKDTTINRGVSSRKTSVDLFNIDDVKEVDGIFIWSGDDIFDNEDE